MPARSLPDVPPEVIRQVLARDRCCCLCGRARGLDAWRHSEPSVAGESPANFSAMCGGCMAMMVGKGVAPARYIVHVRDAGPAWRRLRIWLAEGLTIAVGAAYVAFVVFLVWAVERVPVTQWGLVTDAAIFFAMVLLLAVIVSGLLDRWRAGEARRVPSRELAKERSC